MRWALLGIAAQKARFCADLTDRPDLVKEGDCNAGLLKLCEIGTKPSPDRAGGEEKKGTNDLRRTRQRISFAQTRQNNQLTSKKTP